MNTLRNPIVEIRNSISHTKTSKDIDSELKLRKKLYYNKYYYPDDQILFSDNYGDLKEYQERFEEKTRSDEDFKNDLLIERDEKNVDNTKLNPQTEHEIKEPDPDEKINLKKNKKHPL